ncbi:MAG: SIS domain-containing protein [Bacteroidales bacterium]|nr:SIS domain-containing protein [Bacteroidales bacterium]
MKKIIADSLCEAQKALEQFVGNPASVDSIEAAALIMTECLRAGGKIMSCGNGGSLCDATHFAEELTGRYRGNRRPLPAMAVNDPAYLTCTANDFEYDVVYARSVEAFGKPGDVLLAISTSGNSSNVVKAAEAARAAGMKVVGLTAEGKTRLQELSHVCICAPRTAHSDRIQEIHIKVIHILIELIESGLGFC